MSGSKVWPCYLVIPERGLQGIIRCDKYIKRLRLQVPYAKQNQIILVFVGFAGSLPTLPHMPWSDWKVLWRPFYLVFALYLVLGVFCLCLVSKRKALEVLAVFACGLWSILKVVGGAPLLPLFYDFMISCGDLLYLIVCKDKGWPIQKNCIPRKENFIVKKVLGTMFQRKKDVFLS